MALGARLDLAQLMSEGNAGVARIPGKHGGVPTAFATLAVLVDDEPELWHGCWQILATWGLTLKICGWSTPRARPSAVAEVA